MKILIMYTAVFAVVNLWANTSYPVAQVSFVYNSDGNNKGKSYTARLNDRGYVEVFEGEGINHSFNDMLGGMLAYSKNQLPSIIKLSRQLFKTQLQVNHSPVTCEMTIPTVTNDLFVFSPKFPSGGGARLVLTQHGCWRALNIHPQNNPLRKQAALLNTELLAIGQEFLAIKEIEDAYHHPPD